MKKVVAMMLVFVLAFAFVACNNNTDDTSKPDPASSAAPAESKPEEKSEEASKEDSKPAEESSKAEESSEEELQSHLLQMQILVTVCLQNVVPSSE